jgi:hypothetical protein
LIKFKCVLVNINWITSFQKSLIMYGYRGHFHSSPYKISFLSFLKACHYVNIQPNIFKLDQLTNFDVNWISFNNAVPVLYSFLKSLIEEKLRLENTWKQAWNHNERENVSMATLKLLKTHKLFPVNLRNKL